jgi:hypothetical protein
MSREELIFADIEEALRANIKMESIRLKASEQHITSSIHEYTLNTLETLLNDIQKIERKYTDGTCQRGNH